MSQTPETLHTLGSELPRPWRLPEEVRQTFEIVRVHAATAYIAGHGPVDDTEILMHGKVGEDPDDRGGLSVGSVDGPGHHRVAAPRNREPGADHLASGDGVRERCAGLGGTSAHARGGRLLRRDHRALRNARPARSRNDRC